MLLPHRRSGRASLSARGLRLAADSWFAPLAPGTRVAFMLIRAPPQEEFGNMRDEIPLELTLQMGRYILGALSLRVARC